MPNRGSPVNRRTWLASVGATLFLARLRTETTLLRATSGVAQSVDFSNDAVWSELATEAFATTARTTPFHPEVNALVEVPER